MPRLQVCYQNQAEALHNGSGLERRSGGMSERWLLQKSRRERYAVRDDVSCVDEKDALPADRVPPNRSPVGWISGKTGLLAGGAYAL